MVFDLERSITFSDSPGVHPSSQFLAVNIQHGVASHYSEGQLSLEGGILSIYCTVAVIHFSGKLLNCLFSST